MGGSAWKIHPGELTGHRMAEEVAREYRLSVVRPRISDRHRRTIEATASDCMKGLDG